MVKTLKMLKCLRRYALLRVLHIVWSVSQVFTNDRTRLNWYCVTAHPEDSQRWSKHVGELCNKTSLCAVVGLLFIY
jgi:hypothetical protein